MLQFVSAIQSALGLKRVCPSCGASQTVRLEDRKKPVTCNQCGKKIPPHPKQS